MKLKPKIAFSWSILCTICIVFLLNAPILAQKIDTSKITIKPKAKIVSRIPIIKADITPYKPNTSAYGTPSSGIPSSTAQKTGKMITILKVYPNPVTEQININFRLDRETTVTIKIADMLGNDVVILLTNERLTGGEQTKTFPVPSKLNPGMYYLKINAGGAPAAAKISVL